MNKNYNLIFSLLLLPGFLFAQHPNWQNSDLKKDSVFGISTDKAYHELLTGKKPKEVIVAIIDGGIDIEHEDLKANIWTNKNEIAANNIDDDHNGYVDDIHGWYFNGDEVNKNAFALMTVRQKALYDSLSYTEVPGSYKAGYQAYRKMLKAYSEQQSQAQFAAFRLTQFKNILDAILKGIGKEKPEITDFEHYHSQNNEQKNTQKIMREALKGETDFAHFYQVQLLAPLHYFSQQSIDLFMKQDGSRPNIEEFFKRLDDMKRWLNPEDPIEPFAGHGTHVAGIIGAIRNNGSGMDGIADDVKLMSLKVNGNYLSDQSDAEIANAIRYGADNGAKVINISLLIGNKSLVASAAQYAASKDVLIVHGCGNDGRNLENDGRLFQEAWIDVGASGPEDDSTLVAKFSNYGKIAIDVFAPGVKIYSTVIGNRYETYNGTSMAAPVVSGVAALIREYYPKLTAVQVKEIIIRSVVKPTHQVMIRENGERKKVFMSDICVSGGIVNAYDALKLAANYHEHVQ